MERNGIVSSVASTEIDATTLVRVQAKRVVGKYFLLGNAFNLVQIAFVHDQ